MLYPWYWHRIKNFPFILDRNLAKANFTENHVCTSCDTWWQSNNITLRMVFNCITKVMNLRHSLQCTWLCNCMLRSFLWILVYKQKEISGAATSPIPPSLPPPQTLFFPMNHFSSPVSLPYPPPLHCCVTSLWLHQLKFSITFQNIYQILRFLFNSNNSVSVSKLFKILLIKFNRKSFFILFYFCNNFFCSFSLKIA